MSWKLLDRFLLFRHSLFSLPWFLLSILYLSSHYPPLVTSPSIWGRLFLAFISLRSFGMALNRLVDREIDRRNPRTESRPLPSGQMSLRGAQGVALISLLLFALCLLTLERGVLLWSLLPLALIFSYSWTKRWSPFCHFWLGAIYFFLPLLISEALFGRIEVEALWLGAASGALMTVGDLLYAIQDQSFDRKEGLKSFPSSFGVEVTLWTSRLLLFIALYFLCLLHLELGALLVGLLWGAFLWHPKIRSGDFSNRAFQICPPLGGTLILLSYLDLHQCLIS